jgi:hypothetical protein
MEREALTHGFAFFAGGLVACILIIVLFIGATKRANNKKKRN